MSATGYAPMPCRTALRDQCQPSRYDRQVPPLTGDVDFMPAHMHAFDSMATASSIARAYQVRKRGIAGITRSIHARADC